MNYRDYYTYNRRACQTVETFFSLWMWHHAGRPTTDHCAETIGINCYSPRETDDFTQTLDKYEIKAWISPKNELDSLISINEFSKTDQCLRGFLSVDFYDFGMVRTLTRRRIRFWWQFSSWKFSPESNSSHCERSNHTKIIKIHREKPFQTTFGFT